MCDRIGIAKKINAHGRCGCSQRNAALLEFRCEVFSGKAVIGVAARDENADAGCKGKVGLGLEVMWLRNEWRTRR